MSEQLIFLQSEPRGPSQLIEVKALQNGLQRIPFEDQTQLKSTSEKKIIVKGWRLITADVLTNAPMSGNVNAPITELQKMSLVIHAEGWEKGFQIPLLTMNDMQLVGGTSPNAPQMMLFNNWTSIDWVKCYIQLSNGTNVAGQPYSVIFDILYAQFDNMGQEIRKPL